MGNPVGGGSSASLRGELEVEAVARKMFYGGCALLPWLWLVNIIYFRKLYFAENCPPGVRKCKPGNVRVLGPNSLQPLFHRVESIWSARL
jgi:hypothetical protein